MEFDTRLAAYAVVVDGAGNILLALWNERDRPLWSMPGGGVELDETTEQGAIREVKEETGFDVEIDGLLGIDSVVIPAEIRLSPGDRPLKGVRVIYSAHVTGGVLTNEVGGSTEEARWFPLAAVNGVERVDLVDISIGLWRASSKR
jgi:8-oxo-dGTP diphosphatase